MNLNKKIAVILIPLLILSTVLSGCISEEETRPIINDASRNKPPKTVISTSGTINPPPEYINLTMIDAAAYAGDIITFDASDSYDPDGEIASYMWIWADNTNSEGVKVTRQFEIDNIFDLQGLPLVFSIILQVEDNNQSKDLLDYRIGIIPKKHIFYFDSNELKLEKSEQGKDLLKVTLGKLRPAQELNYKLKESIYIQKCTWNVTVYLEKPLFTMVNKLSILLYDNEGNQITRKDEDLGVITLWREKTIQIKGSSNKKEEFKSIKLFVYGFSLQEKTSILYGGEKASQICFDFTT